MGLIGLGEEKRVRNSVSDVPDVETDDGEEVEEDTEEDRRDGLEEACSGFVIG